MLELISVMDRLRNECPWDKQQTHQSLARYLLEETYETLEAIEDGDPEHLREELGDLLLQVYFHARVASEAHDESFDIEDVAAGIVEKLVRRHPHVFARDDDAAGRSSGAVASGAVPSGAVSSGAVPSAVVSSEEVEANWETIKAAEKGRHSVLDGVPLALPALTLADKVLARAARIGVSPADASDLSDPSDPSDLGDPSDPSDPSDLGDKIMALVVEARVTGRDAEQQLRGAVRRLADQVRTAES